MGFKLGRQNSKEKREQRQKETKQTILLARDCLSDEKFKRYKEKAIAQSELIEKAMDDLDASALTPVEYAFKMRALRIERKYNRLLLKDIEAEAKTEVKIEKEEKEDAGK